MNELIAISYRRHDSEAFAGRIYDRLRRYFSESEIFIDVESLRTADDFHISLSNVFATCKILLAIIGPAWESGERIMDEADWVRKEIAVVLNRQQLGGDVTVIPVLVGSREDMPFSDSPAPSAPEGLEAFGRIVATKVRHDTFTSDMERILTIIKTKLSINNLVDKTVVRTTGGISGKHDQFSPSSSIREKIKSAKSIKILETWISPVYRTIKPELESALTQGCSVQVVILDPESIIFRQRSFERSRPYPQTNNEQTQRFEEAFNQYKDGLALLRSLAQLSNNRGKIEVRINNFLPSFQSFLLDDEWALVGFYWFGSSSVDSHHFEICDRSNRFVELTISEFNMRWDISPKYVDLQTGEIKLRP